MVGTAVPFGRVTMTRPNNLRLQLRGTSQGVIEVVNLEPEKDAIPGCDVRVPDRTMMMLHIPAMQLKNKPAVCNKTVIMRATMITLTTKEPLIPATARFNVAHANKWLWTHRISGLTRNGMH
jgi:hypothetical protein